MTGSSDLQPLVIIQARMESTRLPRKALLPVAGKPLICHVIERALAIKGTFGVVLATGDTPENKVLLELAGSMGIGFFAGSADDVLDRFCRAAERFSGDPIIRITGDNPFTDPEEASKTIEYYHEMNAEYAVAEGLPLGTGVEVVSRRALFDADLKGRESYHREHVTPYIREHSELYRSVRRKTDFQKDGQVFRLTVDTEEDLDLVRRIMDAMPVGRIPSLGEIIAYLRANPDIALLNSEIVQRPMTHASQEK